MEYKEFINSKTKELIKQGLDQRAAIAMAHQLYNQGQNIQTAQQGATINPNPYYQQYNPYFAQAPGQIPPTTQNVPTAMGETSQVPTNFQYVQGDYNLSGTVDAADKVDKFGQPVTSAPDKNVEYFNRYKILNPYGGYNLEASLAETGRNIGAKNYGQAAGFGALSVLKGARTFLSGMAGGKSERDAYNEYLRNQSEANTQYTPIAREGGEFHSGVEHLKYYQQGGQLSIADALTGDFTTDNPNNPKSNVEVESGEAIKNSQTGEVTEAVGETHENGGIKTELPNASKVISNFTQVGAKNAKDFSKEYDIKVKSSDTFADVMKKVKKSLGLDDLIKQEAELLKEVEDQMKGAKDQNTQDVNMKFLQQKLEDVQAQKQPLEAAQSKIFDHIFQEQEKIPKQGKPNEILQKKKEGGNIYSNDLMQVANKYGIAPQRLHELMQQGGETQQGGEVQQPTPEQIIQAYAEANQQDPQAIVAELQKMQPEEQQQALAQMAQSIQPQQQTLEGGGEMLATQQSVMQQGGTMVNSTGKEDFTQIPSTLEYLPYTPMATAGNELWKPENYETKWKPLVQATMADPERAKKVDEWLMSNAGKFSPNIKKQLEGLSGEERKKKIQALATDAKPGAFHNAFLQATQQTQVETPAQVGAQKEYQTREMAQVANLPTDLNLAPSALTPIKKQEVQFGRLDPSHITAEANLSEIGRQQNLATMNLSSLPDMQRAAVMAQVLGTGQQAANEAITKAQSYNAGMDQQAATFNINQASKEQLTNLQLAQDYEKKSLMGLSNREIALQNYYNVLNKQNRVNYGDIENANLLNATAENYAYLPGQGVTFLNNPLNFQAGLNTLKGLSPQQQKDYYNLMMQMNKNQK